MSCEEVKSLLVRSRLRKVVNNSLNARASASGRYVQSRSDRPSHGRVWLASP